MEFKNPKPEFGSVMAGIYVRSHEQAILLQQMIVREMKDRAGKPEESVLANWNNELARIRSSAREKEWTGWG